MKKNDNIKKDNIIKRWWKLTQPHKGYFIGQIIFFCAYTIILALITIFAAKTINFMYAGKWKMAYLFLGLELSTIIFGNGSLHIQYKFYGKMVSHIRSGVARKVYNKIISCKSEEFDKVSKEKVINIAMNNVGSLSEFPDAIAQFIGYAMQVVFVLITVFSNSPIAGAIVSALGVVNFFVFLFINKKLGRIMLERYEKNDDMFKSYSKVIDGKNVIKELDGKEKYEHELIEYSEGFNRAYKRYYNTYSFKINIYYIIWMSVIYAIAAFLMYTVSKGSLDISIYLVIVPYLTTCTTKLNSLFDKISSLENTRVDVDRINLILDLKDEELVEYGKINTVSDGYTLNLVDVTCRAKQKKHQLLNADISFKTGGINVIKGPKGDGKRTVFDLLRRHIKPTGGRVLLDNLDLYDYNEKTFKNHIDYCASHPTFITGTIQENLMLVEKDMDKIISVCEKVGILNEIMELPLAFNSQISEIKSSTSLFLLGVARALLSNCKILMVYEIPSDAPEEFRKQIAKFLQDYFIDKTLILFTHSDDYDNLAEVVYLIDKGNVSLIKNNIAD